MSHIWTDITSIIFAFTSIVLIFIILLQRGRGGGLAGAFGASGGQSAFGTKAGDVFTKITIGIAFVWVIMAAATGFAMRAENSNKFEPKIQDVGEPGGSSVDVLPRGTKSVGGKGEERPESTAPSKSGNAIAPTTKSSPPTAPSKPVPTGGAGDATNKSTPTK